MRFIFEHRASIILYNVLKEFSKKGKFILPANVCPVVPLTFLKARVSFDFVDIDETDQCINCDLVLDKINNSDESYCGLLFVRAYGLLTDKTDFFKSIKTLNRDFFIIDDRCLTIPQPFQDSFDSSVDLIIYSTGYSKFVDLNYGGFGYLDEKTEYVRRSLDFDSRDHEDQIKLIQRHLNDHSKFKYKDNNWLGDTCHIEDDKGYREKVQRQISIVSKHKEIINSIYADLLPNDIRKETTTDWRFNISVINKSEILEEIFRSGLFASSHYASVSEIFGFNNCSIASKEHNNTINLFNDFRVNEEFAIRICRIINNHIY